MRHEILGHYTLYFKMCFSLSFSTRGRGISITEQLSFKILRTMFISNVIVAYEKVETYIVTSTCQNFIEQSEHIRLQQLYHDAFTINVKLH